MFIPTEKVTQYYINIYIYITNIYTAGKKKENMYLHIYKANKKIILG